MKGGSKVSVNTQEIYQFLLSRQYNLSSDRIFKEPEKHSEVIWQILVDLCGLLRHHSIDKIIGTMIYILDEPQKHQQSMKWLRNHLVVSQTLYKLRLQYRLIDYLKPEKDNICLVLYRVIQAVKYAEKMKIANQQMVVKLQFHRKEMQKCKSTHQEITIQLDDVRLKKKNQLPLYEEKIKNIQTINEEINYKRQEKVDLLTSQKELQEEIYRKEKNLSDEKFQNQQSRFQIAQLKKQISKNAPEIKKQKRAIQEQYHQLTQTYSKEQKCLRMRSDAAHSSIEKRKQTLFKPQNIEAMRNLFETIKESNKIIEENINKQQQLNLKIQEYLQEDRLLVDKLSHQYDENIIDLNTCSDLKANHQKQFIQCSKASQNDKKITYTVHSTQEALEKQEKFSSDLEIKINQISEKYQSKIDSLEKQMEDWEKGADQAIETIFQAFKI